MPGIRLIGIDRTMAEALVEADACFENRYAVTLGEHGALVRDVVRQTLSMIEAAPRPAPWGGYLAVDEDSRAVVGTCAFKTGPMGDGTVEIAYFTFPPFEGRGYATAMAGQLTAVARASSCVQMVIAHTLPERNASTRVLEKAGMQWVGQVEDPEDGRVWQWQYPIDGQPPRSPAG